MKNKKLDRENIEDILALTPMQEGLLFQYITNMDSDQYFEQLSLRVDGSIDMALFKKAWNFVAGMNQMLRTVFRWDKLEKPVQIVLKNYDIPVREYDLSGFDYENKMERLEKIRIEDRNEKIDISHEPFRVTLVGLGKLEYEVIISNHHILYDGWSNGIILKEFINAYKDFYEGREPVKYLKSGYKEFVKLSQLQDRVSQKKYWQEYLAGFDTKTGLPADRLKQGDIVKAKEHIVNEQGIASRISDFTKEYNTTLAVVLYSAWGILLQKYGNSNDVVFGTVISGRPPRIKEVDSIVGLFINTLPLRVESKEEDYVLSIISKVNNSIMDREEYEGTPLIDIKSNSELKGNSTLFDSIVVLENYPLDAQLNKDGCIKIKSYSMFEVTSFDLTLTVTSFEGKIDFKFSYNSEIFLDETIKRLSNHFINILNEIIENPYIKLSEIQMLSEEEKKHILYDFNPGPTSYPRDISICRMFEEQAYNNADNIALTFMGNSMTYGQLNSKANQLAWLLKEKGIKKNSLVGIMVERSFEMIIGILAVLKAGGAYVPIDPDYPEQRINYLLSNSKIPLLITQGKFVERGYAIRSEVLAVDQVLSNFNLPSYNLNEDYDPEQLMYVLYTSGSTGNPKGVMIKSHAFVNLLNWFTSEFDIDNSSSILLIAPTSFDLAQKNLYSSLIKGGRLCLFSPGLYDYIEMSNTIEREQIDTINCSPSAFYPLLDCNMDSDFIKLKSLSKVFLGGEPINTIKLSEWTKSSNYNGEIVNTYGPTECTDISSYFRLDNKNIGRYVSVPIGKPVHNTRLYVLGKDMGIQPVGIPGELCIGGIGLAEGYYNDPELNKKKFVDFTYMTKEKIYKTGDLVKWLPDGNMEFLGRLDHQVKVRGVRIELGEIESRMLQHRLVKEAVVIDRENPGGDKYLCAYFVSDEKLSENELKSFLENELPSYMIPSHFIKMDKLPLTPNGKINRKEMPEPLSGSLNKAEYSEPVSETEKRLVEIWQKVLGIERVGINENFFDIGGNSILLMQMHVNVERVFPGKVLITDLFSHPTISKLAKYIDRANKNTSCIVDIKPVTFPKMFFTDGLYEQDGALLKLMFERQFLDNFSRMAKKEKVRIKDVLLSIYIYLLSEISGQKVLDVQAAVIPNDTVFSINADLNEISDFYTLFKMINGVLQPENVENRYDIECIKDLRISNDAHTVIPLFVDKGFQTKEVKLVDFYDIVLEVEERDEGINLICEYNDKRLSKERMKEFINNYIELSRLLIENYEF
ncbi:MAG: non-ribosomal peptide synthetase [Bacillota bacterium]